MILFITLSLMFGMIDGLDQRVEQLTDTLSSRVVIDQDGNEYIARKIGSQWWFVTNLRVKTYANGDPIERISDNSEWSEARVGAFSAYNNDESLVEQHGYLYNWYAIRDPRGICPTGWEIPSDEAWIVMERYLGMDGLDVYDAGARGTNNNIGGMLKDTTSLFWAQPNVGADNKTGFSGTGSGSRYFNGKFSGLGRTGFWWTSSHRNTGGLYPNRVWIRFLSHHAPYISRISAFMESGMSVRCVSRD